MKSSKDSWDQIVAAALRTPPTLTAVEVHNLNVHRWRDQFHLANYNELIHVLHGRARIEGRRRSFEVDAGDTFVLPEKMLHRDHCEDDNDFTVIYVFFRWPTGRKLLDGIDPVRLHASPASMKTHVHWMIKELQDEYLGEFRGAASRMQIMLLEILLCLFRQSRKDDAVRPRAKDIVAMERRRALACKVREYLLANLTEGMDLERLADRFNVSPFHLCRAFSQEFRMSMTEMLAAARMERAKELLRNPDEPVKLVAGKVGLPDPNYFAKVFRKITGVSPSEFRLAAGKRRKDSGGR